MTIITEVVTNNIQKDLFKNSQEQQRQTTKYAGGKSSFGLLFFFFLLIYKHKNCFRIDCIFL